VRRLATCHVLGGGARRQQDLGRRCVNVIIMLMYVYKYMYIYNAYNVDIDMWVV